MLVISFNSYKGGACRTTTCYNTLPYLAEKLGATSKNPLLVFDVDLDSMGLTSLFIGAQKKNAPKKKYSARHLFVDDEDGINNSLEPGCFSSVEEDDWYFGNFIKVGTHLGLSDNGSVLFCGADANADVISDDQYNRMKNSSPFKKLTDALSDMGANAPRAIVLDCAAGAQLSTLNVITSVDRSVMCMRPTTQFRIGTCDYLVNTLPKRLINYSSSKKREIILLPTAVSPIIVDEKDPNKSEVEKELKKLRFEVYDKIDDEIINVVLSENDKGSLGYTLNYSMADITNDIMGIPEIQRFKWTESDLIHDLKQKHSLSEQEKLLESRYIMLAEMLAKEIR